MYCSLENSSFPLQPHMVIHELGHLVGMWHTHARWDRDAHVIIYWNNLKNPHLTRQNFQKHDNMRLLVPYDLSSIMHYDLNVGNCVCVGGGV